MVQFFVNLLAAIYGLIGFFSIIPFLMLFFFFAFGISDYSGPDAPQGLILMTVLGLTSFLGIAIVFLVHRRNDLGRKLMIAYTLGIVSALCGILWRGKIGSHILTTAAIVGFSATIGLLLFVTGLLCFRRTKQFFSS